MNTYLLSSCPTKQMTYRKIYRALALQMNLLFSDHPCFFFQTTFRISFKTYGQSAGAKNKYMQFQTRINFNSFIFNTTKSFTKITSKTHYKQYFSTHYGHVENLREYSSSHIIFIRFHLSAPVSLMNYSEHVQFVYALVLAELFQTWTWKYKCDYSHVNLDIWIKTPILLSTLRSVLQTGRIRGD